MKRKNELNNSTEGGLEIHWLQGSKAGKRCRERGKSEDEIEGKAGERKGQTIEGTSVESAEQLLANLSCRSTQEGRECEEDVGERIG